MHGFATRLSGRAAVPHVFIRRAFRALILVQLGLLALFGAAAPLQAQTQTGDPLVVAFPLSPPFSMRDETGARTGFFIELARLIGAELGRPIEFRDVSSLPEVLALQASGETDLIAGIASLPVLQESSLFSDTVAVGKLRLAVLDDHLEAIETGTVIGKRVGIIPPAVGSNQQALLAQNEVVAFPSPDAAVMGLLVGKVDALLAPEPMVYTLARSARADGRIRFVGESLSTVTRVVAVHKDHADLLGPINAAIAGMEADGRLEALRSQFNVAIPPPPPEVLTIGYSDFRPYKFTGPDGEATGFSVEVLQRLLSRAGLKGNFIPISREDWLRGPRVGAFDMMTLTNISPDRLANMDLTLPVLETRIAVFTRKGAETDLNTSADLGGRTIGVVEGNLGESMLQDRSDLTMRVYPTRYELLTALLRDEVEAIIYTSNNLLATAETRGVQDQLQEIEPPLLVTSAAPALRFGLGEVRERLNAVIPGFLISEDYAALRYKYFGAPVFWTQPRIYMALGAAAALVLSVFGIGAGLAWRDRTRRAAAVARARDELETVLNAASSGIIALNARHQIVRINRPARHFLGGITKPVPFDWPPTIKFLDGETLEPLDASADPLRRALTGHEFYHQTHLMTRSDKSDEQRYVRISSTKLDTTGAESDEIAVVFVMDDISEEERNRQVVERRNRLDALGQLTGGIAHDFNNLLASQLYAIELVRKAEDPTKRAQLIEIAKNSIQRGRALTSRLLSFARRQPGLATVRQASKVFAEFESLVTPMLEAHINLEFEMPPEELPVYCDHTQLETALMNLVLNSRDAILRSGKGSRVSLLARAVQAPEQGQRTDLQKDFVPGPGAPVPAGHALRYVEFVVSDNGPGMTEEVLSRCTDPFFTTKDTNSGTGLGLAMVYGFVRQSDGDLKIYSEEGLGTTIRMLLPRGSPQGEREIAVPQEASQRGNGETILVVEDESNLLIVMCEVLKDLGYNVVSAQSGQEALTLIEKGQRFDLLLTDVVMPGQIGGFELARRVRRSHPDVPVIYTSGYVGFTAAEMGSVQAPILQKPATPNELAKSIRKALHSATESVLAK